MFHYLTRLPWQAKIEKKRTLKLTQTQATPVWFPKGPRDHTPYKDNKEQENVVGRYPGNTAGAT